MVTLQVILTGLSLVATIFLYLELKKLEPSILGIAHTTGQASSVVDKISAALGV